MAKQNIRRYFNILNYLKNHTDKENRVSQAEMIRHFVPEYVPGRKLSKEDEEKVKFLLGGKKTRHDTIVELADIFSQDGALPEEEWLVIFDDYIKAYGDIDNDDIEIYSDEENKDITLRIQGLYYNQPFSREEVETIISGLQVSGIASPEKISELVKKIQRELLIEKNRIDRGNIITVQNTVHVDRQELQNSLRVLSRAVKEKLQVRFDFYGYNRCGEMEYILSHENISPYYVVAYNRGYYLIANKEGFNDYRIWRIDMMKNVAFRQIRGKDDKQINVPAFPKSKVSGLPAVWDKTFTMKHINMFSDHPEEILLSVKCGERPDYLFMYDWFGDTFEVLGKDAKNKGSDLVRVFCSPKSIVYWALQYADRVEVQKPDKVRASIKEAILMLTQKYDIKEKNNINCKCEESR